MNRDLREIYTVGKVCPHCKSTRKYVSNGRCIYCEAERKRKLRAARVDPEQQALRAAVYRARTEAAESGKMTFISPRPCHAGHYERYVAYGKCVECSREYGRAWKEKNYARHLEALKKWQAVNAEYVKNYRAAARAKKREEAAQCPA